MISNNLLMPRFPELMHQILKDAEDKGEEQIVSWLPCGLRFKIHDTKAFAKNVMPRYFKNDRYKSFLRQLSLYEFRRGGWKNTPGPKGSYDHPFFTKGRLDLAVRVLRVKDRKRTKSAWSMAKTDDISSTSSTACTSYSSMSSSTTISTEKYLDPNVIVNSSAFSWDLLVEIVNTFSTSRDHAKKEGAKNISSTELEKDTNLYDPIMVNWEHDKDLMDAADFEELDLDLKGDFGCMTR